MKGFHSNEAYVNIRFMYSKAKNNERGAAHLYYEALPYQNRTLIAAHSQRCIYFSENTIFE